MTCLDTVFWCKWRGHDRPTVEVEPFLSMNWPVSRWVLRISTGAGSEWWGDSEAGAAAVWRCSMTWTSKSPM